MMGIYLENVLLGLFIVYLLRDVIFNYISRPVLRWIYGKNMPKREIKPW